MTSVVFCLFGVFLLANAAGGTEGDVNGPATPGINTEAFQPDDDDAYLVIPGKPWNLRVFSTNLWCDTFTTAIIVEWSPPRDWDVTLPRYILGYRKGIDDDVIYTQIEDPWQHTHTLKNLDRSSEYVISLQSFNGIGLGQAIYETVFTHDPQCAESVLPADYTCDDMGHDLYRATLVYINLLYDLDLSIRGQVSREEWYALVKSEVLKFTWVDIDDGDTFKTFSCKLIGVKRIDDLSIVLKSTGPPMGPQFIYRSMVRGIDQAGGLDKLQMMWQVYRQFLIAADDAGYPNWPLNITSERAHSFISGMVADFGDNFLQYATPRETNKDTVDVDRFVEAVTEATTYIEFAEMSGLSLQTLRGMNGALQFVERSESMSVEDFTDMGDALIRIVLMLDRHYLFDLQ